LFRYSRQRAAYGGPFALWGAAAVYTFIGLVLGLYGLAQGNGETLLFMLKYWSIWMGWLFSWSVVALFCELNTLESATAEYERANQLYSPATAFLNGPASFQQNNNFTSCP
jgi:ABC-type Na+ efflux pump permease subunit